MKVLLVVLAVLLIYLAATGKAGAIVRAIRTASPTAAPAVVTVSH